MATLSGDEILDRSPQGRYIRFNTKLGSGAYKTVYKAYDTREGIEVAWNQVDIASMPKGEKNRIIQEVKLLQTLEHKNIINFHGSWVNRDKQQVVFITEIVTSGTLSSFIKRVQLVRWKIIKRWCRQILEGLKYLHSHEPPIIHRDLKCDNIFINGSTGDLRIGDLGLSTQLAVGRNAQSVLGTPEFMAPELYDENYDEKVDIYAFGMCVLEMITKEIPYIECVNPAQIYKKVTAGIRPAALQRVKSTEAREFIELCLSRGAGVVDVTADTLLSSPFLQEGPNDDEEVIVERGPSIPETVLEHENDDEDMGEIDSEFLPQRRASITVTRPFDIEAPEPLPITTGNTVYAPVDAEGILQSMPNMESNLRSKQMTIMSGRGEVLQEPDTRPESQWGPSPRIRAAREAEAARAAESNFMAQFVKENASEGGNTAGEERTESGGDGHKHPGSQGKIGSEGYIPASQTNVPGPPGMHAADGVKRKKIKHEIKSLPDPSHDHSIILLLRVNIEGKSKEIKFSFNLYTDSPHEVSCELAFDVGIPESEVEDIAHSIAYLVSEGKTKRFEKGHIDIWDDAPEPHPFNYRPVSRAGQLSSSSILSTESALPAVVPGPPDSARGSLSEPDAPTLPPTAPAPPALPLPPPPASVSSQPTTTTAIVPSSGTITTQPSTAIPIPPQPAPVPLSVPTVPPVVNVPSISIPTQGLPTPSSSGQGHISHTPTTPGHLLATTPPSLPGALAVHSSQAGQPSYLLPSPHDEARNPLHMPTLRQGSSSSSIGDAQLPLENGYTSGVNSDGETSSVKRREYEKQLKFATSAFDHRDYSLEMAMRDEEEKHKKELERHRKRMEEFQRKKQRAQEMKEQRLQKFEAEWKEAERRHVDVYPPGLQRMSSGSPPFAGTSGPGNIPSLSLSLSEAKGKSSMTPPFIDTSVNPGHMLSSSTNPLSINTLPLSQPGVRPGMYQKSSLDDLLAQPLSASHASTIPDVHMPLRPSSVGSTPTQQGRGFSGSWQSQKDITAAFNSLYSTSPSTTSILSPPGGSHLQGPMGMMTGSAVAGKPGDSGNRS